MNNMPVLPPLLVELSATGVDTCVEGKTEKLTVAGVSFTPSLAIMLAWKLPAVCKIPEITPDLESVKPVGKLLELKVIPSPSASVKSSESDVCKA